ncbi:C2H2 finger domain transcription factor CON7 [Fulvia fulva]|uniref:C2H2 finger domain transcription factor CON7 n=1 Tax=Passalora fulva TaxID=5499 RepID=A0A9Q8PDE6_PASFU|nr:C2H2 finger domain transcription factor CON7 [Fulvia fulva]KAK4620195.1 C2H2 finger domain transcription factor CON7 [Fulvia fulva]KAK4620439.1 C2H2 finger domain transcription factor CON7 [Fulvia fulva]UJO20390.1 C2H2 finger domain transcription factor CON7 [Fulvia fulva]WPV17396.1 C2H2 finger domain transcription factor CON7 [Fulvia fulva]WPV32445.1 C2H2 finger domain transcription factor CON7 [Fulvia fulva]
MSRGYNTPSTKTNANTNDSSLNALLTSHLQPGPPRQSMDGRQPNYPQSGLDSPYASYNEHQSEGSSADQASAVQYQQPQDYKSSNYSASATPDSSYGLPQSARSGSFPEYIQRSYADGQQQERYPAGAQQSGMAQTSSPSLPMANGQNANNASKNADSDDEVPIDPSIAQSSPSYPHNYSPYPQQQQQQQQHDMPQYAGQPNMQYQRPEWAGQYPQAMSYGHSPATTGGAAPNMVAHAIPRPPAVGTYYGAPPVVYPNVSQGGHPLSTVYSFVPIPGAQQHKRPRRRYEEIERMYKCGWNGCEKAYGTLNHLNAHVTMQSHGTKRTPEEFKEIRKEWKAKKKEEENQRKAEEERQRQEAQRTGQDTSQSQGQPGQYGQHMMQPQMGGPQLPPIGYQPAGGQPSQYAQAQQVDGAQQYSNNSQMYGAQGYPQSPYGQGGLPYQQQRA